MNYLSDKLSKAMGDHVLPSAKKYSSLSPSAASVVVTEADGTTRVVGACHRQQYYRITGVPQDKNTEVNIDWNLSALIGDKLQDLIEELLDQYGFQMGIQKLTSEHSFFDPKMRLSGRTDIIAWDYTSNEPIGIEVKSIGEYKAKTAISEPIDEHVLQSVVYLDYYNKNIPADQKKIKRWYIWYISRTENWSIKSKTHNSNFAMLWDFCITLDSKGVPLVHGSNFNQRWKDFSIENIYKRYNLLKAHIDTDVVPPRDYELVYSEEKITGLHKADKLTRKTDRDVVDKWLAKGAPIGKLKVSMGDIECRFCEYSDLCWQGIKNTTPRTFSNFPKENVVHQDKEKKPYFL